LCYVFVDANRNVDKDVGMTLRPAAAAGVGGTSPRRERRSAVNIFVLSDLSTDIFVAIGSQRPESPADPAGPSAGRLATPRPP
jgi:hypothetical protein